jgi:hypothetical protein
MSIIGAFSMQEMDLLMHLGESKASIALVVKLLKLM